MCIYFRLLLKHCFSPLKWPLFTDICSTCATETTAGTASVYCVYNHAVYRSGLYMYMCSRYLFACTVNNLNIPQDRCTVHVYLNIV